VTVTAGELSPRRPSVDGSEKTARHSYVAVGDWRIVYVPEVAAAVILPIEVHVVAPRGRRWSWTTRLETGFAVRRPSAGLSATSSVAVNVTDVPVLIEVAEDRLRVLGPADQDPTAVAFERSIDQMDATGLNERLILNERGSNYDRSVMAFISLAGGTPSGVADEVLQHARQIQGSAP